MILHAVIVIFLLLSSHLVEDGKSFAKALWFDVTYTQWCPVSDSWPISSCGTAQGCSKEGTSSNDCCEYSARNWSCILPNKKTKWRERTIGMKSGKIHDDSWSNNLRGADISLQVKVEIGFADQTMHLMSKKCASDAFCCQVVLSPTWGFPKMGVPPNHSFEIGIFPYKPSSYWGTPILGNPQHQASPFLVPCPNNLGTPLRTQISVPSSLVNLEAQIEKDSLVIRLGSQPHTEIYCVLAYNESRTSRTIF